MISIRIPKNAIGRDGANRSVYQSRSERGIRSVSVATLFQQVKKISSAWAPSVPQNREGRSRFTNTHTSVCNFRYPSFRKRADRAMNHRMGAPLPPHKGRAGRNPRRDRGGALRSGSGSGSFTGNGSAIIGAGVIIIRSCSFKLVDRKHAWLISRDSTDQLDVEAIAIRICTHVRFDVGVLKKATSVSGTVSIGSRFIEINECALSN